MELELVKYVKADDGHVYFLENKKLACAIRLQDDEIDWDSSTIVEEMPKSVEDDAIKIIELLLVGKQEGNEVGDEIAEILSDIEFYEE